MSAAPAPVSAAGALPAPHDLLEDFGSYRLAAQYRWPAGERSVPLLALHGARANLHRSAGLLAPLQALGVGSLAPSLSGHGPDSPLALEQTSLAQNLHEALRFAERLGPQLRMVFGSSMGGALALRVAEHMSEHHARPLQVLALSGPALYPEAAWTAPHFGTPFRAAISQPFGFLASRSLDFVRRFAGRLVLIQGEWDGLPATAHGAPAGRSAGEVTITLPDGRQRPVYSPIPAEVFSALADAAGPRLLHIVIAGTDHRVSGHLLQHPPVAHSLARLLQQALHAPQTLPAAQRLRIDMQGHALPA